MAKYIFVTGGVVSSLGKGITAASLGRLLKARGLKVAIQKFDPYLNVDPGMMNPFQHGEVFVTDDGAETDLDLGHYERFIDETLSQRSSVTSGKVYLSVINKERSGEYDGATVQVVPHITDEIKERIRQTADGVDVVITEIGGTVGDIESQPFLEAIRQMQLETASNECLYIHVTLVPFLESSGEIKTKPTQHSVKELQGMGIQPDFIICRCERNIPRTDRSKIAMFCNVKLDHIIANTNCNSLYEVPIMLENSGLGTLVCEDLGIDVPPPDLAEWEDIVTRHLHPRHEVTIALVGKYVKLRDAYLSLAEALTHASLFHKTKVNILWMSADELSEEKIGETLQGISGIILPGSGLRNVENVVRVVEFARTRKIPFFGVCLGMQAAVVEIARSLAGLVGANSTEADPATADPVLKVMDAVAGEGGSESEDKVRRGGYACCLRDGTHAMKAYQAGMIRERHRNRFEVNFDYLGPLEGAGLVVAGTQPETGYVDIIELSQEMHPWFVGVQFFPEFLSRPNRPHPLFRDFIGCALQYAKENNL
ncbi:MAG: CTP synthase [Gracilibacteraceae bacterium]|jgi:CTP synthase|nr:CTP synthase [Gracilibacteraceae bacterium]